MSLSVQHRFETKGAIRRAGAITHVMSDRCARATGWVARALSSEQAGLHARASVWTNDETVPVTWEATTPYSSYAVVLLLDDAQLAVDGHDRFVDGHACRAGSYYLSRPGESARGSCTGPCRVLRVTIPRQLLAAGPADDEACRAMLPACDPLLLQLARTLLETDGETCESGLRRKVLGLFVDRLRQLRAQAARASVARQRAALPQWRLKRVEGYVNDNLSAHVTLNDMAAAAGLSPMHFAAQFRAATGLRPHHYLLLCRMEHAKRLMAAMPYSILEIAVEVGFQTQAHFTTVFKRITGMTPRQWRSEAAVTYLA